jgi:hypothetical protein
MTIRYTCSECGAVLNIKDDLAGTQGHCPRCQVEFRVPAAEASPVAEKQPAAVGGEPAVTERERAAGAFSEDDIGDILAASSAGSADTDARTAKNPFDQEETATEEEDDSARRKKKRKSSEKPAVKQDSEESASIAKNLMARGEHAAVRDEKKAGRPFGGAGGRAEERPDYTAKDVVKYFASIGWPAVVGMIVLLALSFGLYKWLMPGMKLPPLAEVSGTVTLDGKPLENAIVQFQPITEGPKRDRNLATSFGITDKDGKYSLVYLVIDEQRITGAVIGMHRIVIRATDKEGTDLIPVEYSPTATDDVRKEVVNGGPPIDFALTSKKASPGQ